MKTTLLALLLAFTGRELLAQVPPSTPHTRPPLFPPPASQPAAPTSAAPAQPDEIIPAGTINFQSADLNQVLEVYSMYVGRTLLRPAGLPAGQIVLKTLTPLTKSEVIQALQAVLALNGIAVVNIGDKFVKVLPVDQANSAGAEFNDANATNLPDLGSYVTHIVQLKYVKPSEMVPIIQPFAKLANSILSIDSNGILVLRDNAENVKRMLEMIDKVDISTPTEYVSEVIPIRYAKVDDIASALNALGGSGGTTVSIGTAPSPGRISGMSGTTSGGLGGTGGSSYQPGGSTTSAFGSRSGLGVGGGGATPNGTPTSGSTFQDRLKSIINKASGVSGAAGSGSDQPIMLFGQTKIIPDESSSSLLIYATRPDMDVIKGIIAKLDVPLAQVLIESIIVEVTLGNTLNAGVSAVQHPQQFNNSNVAGGGAMANGTGSFLNFVKSAATNGAANSFSTNALSSGLSYFGSIGNTWDIAVQAAETDNKAHIIQRPRIQTSQAVPAQFFVGQTVPYQTGNYAYGSGGNQVSYSQLSVGVELDVTPFINPEGAVSMQINQEIDEISDQPSAANNYQPSTVKRTLNSTITVRDRDTVILGGFVYSDKNHQVKGVPLLMDIPLLGWLFRSTADNKDHNELMVLMRPTVLKTPQLAAAETIREGQRLPGISDAVADEAAYNRKLIAAERKKELKAATNGGLGDGFYNMNPASVMGTNVPTGDFGTAPDKTAAPAATDTADQDKARAALGEKLKELDAPNAGGSVPPPVLHE